MIQTIARYYSADRLLMKNGDASQPGAVTGVQPFVDAGVTDGIPIIIEGPTDNIPEGQFDCIRTWNSLPAAEQWISLIDGFCARLGVVCLSKTLVE
jgi:hypothetical protein